MGALNEIERNIIHCPDLDKVFSIDGLLRDDVKRPQDEDTPASPALSLISPQKGQETDTKKRPR